MWAPTRNASPSRSSTKLSLSWIWPARADLTSVPESISPASKVSSTSYSWRARRLLASGRGRRLLGLRHGRKCILLDFTAPMRALRPSLCLALAVLAHPAAADPQAAISDLAVRVDGNRALVSFRLDDAFDQRFIERVQSGLPTGFTYRLELLKDRKRWYDRALEDTTLQIAAMYDAISREYLVNTKLGRQAGGQPLGHRPRPPSSAPSPGSRASPPSPSTTCRGAGAFWCGCRPRWGRG